MLIIPWDPNIPPFEVSAEWVQLKEPHAGGYWISYPDGSTGFLMAAFFEQEYGAVGRDPDRADQTDRLTL
jgi:hypothetical protein